MLTNKISETQTEKLIDGVSMTMMTVTKRSSTVVRHWIEGYVWIISTFVACSYISMFKAGLPEPERKTIPWIQSLSDDGAGIASTLDNHEGNVFNGPAFHRPPGVELRSPLQLQDSRLVLVAPSDYPDYGEVGYARAPRLQRLIPPNDGYDEYRQSLIETMDGEDKGLAKRIFYHDDELEEDPPRGCHRNNWKSKFYPSCNTFQENSMLDHVLTDKLQYRGSGYFRDAWAARSASQGKEEVIILKTIRQVMNLGIKMQTSMAREATILEQLSASPRIVDIFGYCGLSMLVENMPFEIEDEIHTTLDRYEVIDLYSDTAYMNSSTHDRPLRLNNLTSVEKLDLAIEMSESLADIHGFPGGVIVHADAHPVQWLRNPEGVLKLNDFNNAIVLDWNHSSQEYCLDFHHIPGTFHGPEENLGQWKVDDRADVFAMGACIFTIITGLYPFWEFHQKERHAAVVHGEIPPIDPRYQNATMHPIESRMLTVMEACFVYEADQRPHIFEIIRWLRNIKKDLLL